MYFSATTYLTKLYCVCVLWHMNDYNQIANISSGNAYIETKLNAEMRMGSKATTMASDWQLLWLKYGENYFNNTDEMVEMGINAGCQVSKWNGQNDLFKIPNIGQRE